MKKLKYINVSATSEDYTIVLPPLVVPLSKLVLPSIMSKAKACFPGGGGTHPNMGLRRIGRRRV